MLQRSIKKILQTRIFVRDDTPLSGIHMRLAQLSASQTRGSAKADGEVVLVCMLRDGTEAELKLNGRYTISPQIAGAIKSVVGVLDVQLEAI